MPAHPHSREQTQVLKICSKCIRQLPIGEFYSRKSTCKQCIKIAKRPRDRLRRRDPSKRALFILKDSIASDKRRGLETNDLTREWIQTAIANGCHYCGETSIQIGLDRINDALGHSRDNVIPACIRCNMTRGAMPHVAWLLLVPGMRAAREQGLFGEWSGTISRGPKTRLALGIKRSKGETT